MQFLLACFLGAIAPAASDTASAPSPTRLVLYVHPISPVIAAGFTQWQGLFLKAGVVFDVPGVRNLIVEGSWWSMHRWNEEEVDSWRDDSPRLYEFGSEYQSLFVGKRFQWLQLFVQPTLQMGRWEVHDQSASVVDKGSTFAAGMVYFGAIPRLDQWRMEVDLGVGRSLFNEIPFAYPHSGLVLDVNARFGYAF